jgi:hypothetical protein
MSAAYNGAVAEDARKFCGLQAPARTIYRRSVVGTLHHRRQEQNPTGRLGAAYHPLDRLPWNPRFGLPRMLRPNTEYARIQSDVASWWPSRSAAV